MLARVSLIDESGQRRVRMGHLAFLGSHRVNGVSALHTELMRQTVFRDLHALYPDRIVNKTNGITFRRWLFQANPALTGVIVDAIGPQVLDDADALDGARGARRGRRVCASASPRCAAPTRWRWRGSSPSGSASMLDADALFDVQIKRIHEYKRQLLNILETVALLPGDARATATRLGRRGSRSSPARRRRATAARSSSSSSSTTSRESINADPTVRGLLKVVFLPNYNVSLAEAIIPGGGPVRSRSRPPGMEASGTGNMKLALNGALTIGTLDGANIEIRERVGRR